MEGSAALKRRSAFVVSALLLLSVAAPALGLEDGIMETSSVTPTDDLTSPVFERTTTTASKIAVDIAPRDLRMASIRR